MTKKQMKKLQKLRGKRWYNGLPSDLMNSIYDQLILHDPEFMNHSWWDVFSLYLARSCRSIERKTRNDEKKQNDIVMELE